MSVPFDAEAIRVLAAILTETGLTEIEVGDKEYRVRVARAPAQIVTTMGLGMGTGAAPAPAEPAAVAVAPSAASDAAHPGAVTSPMVGIVYLAAEPGTPPYVTVGATVAAGQTVLLIEAMKTFNQIKAPRGGVVKKILVATGVPVEFGETLLIIE